MIQNRLIYNVASHFQVDPVGLDWEAAFLGVVENATVPGDQAQLFFMASRRYLPFEYD